MHTITKRELELLKVSWEKGEATAREIHEGSQNVRKRSYQAVKTILDIMVRKDILKRRKIGPVYLYSTKETKKKFINGMINDLIMNVLNGSILPLFVNLIKNKKITKDELAFLKKQIEEMDDDR
ncbi:MAG: BlaI/MecI/CopY family transcriptional regulator [Smithella sp.]